MNLDFFCFSQRLSHAFSLLAMIYILLILIFYYVINILFTNINILNEYKTEAMGKKLLISKHMTPVLPSMQPGQEWFSKHPLYKLGSISNISCTESVIKIIWLSSNVKFLKVNDITYSQIHRIFLSVKMAS